MYSKQSQTDLEGGDTLKIFWQLDTRMRLGLALPRERQVRMQVLMLCMAQIVAV